MSSVCSSDNAEEQDVFDNVNKTNVGRSFSHVIQRIPSFELSDNPDHSNSSGIEDDDDVETSPKKSKIEPKFRRHGSEGDILQDRKLTRLLTSGFKDVDVTNYHKSEEDLIERHYVEKKPVDMLKSRLFSLDSLDNNENSNKNNVANEIIDRKISVSSDTDMKSADVAVLRDENTLKHQLYQISQESQQIPDDISIETWANNSVHRKYGRCALSDKRMYQSLFDEEDSQRIYINKEQTNSYDEMNNEVSSNIPSSSRQPVHRSQSLMTTSNMYVTDLDSLKGIPVLDNNLGSKSKHDIIRAITNGSNLHNQPKEDVFDVSPCELRMNHLEYENTDEVLLQENSLDDRSARNDINLARIKDSCDQSEQFRNFLADVSENSKNSEQNRNEDFSPVKNISTNDHNKFLVSTSISGIYKNTGDGIGIQGNIDDLNNGSKLNAEQLKINAMKEKMRLNLSRDSLLDNVESVKSKTTRRLNSVVKKDSEESRSSQNDTSFSYSPLKSNRRMMDDKLGQRNSRETGMNRSPAMPDGFCANDWGQFRTGKNIETSEDSGTDISPRLRKSRSPNTNAKLRGRCVSNDPMKPNSRNEKAMVQSALSWHDSCKVKRDSFRRGRLSCRTPDESRYSPSVNQRRRSLLFEPSFSTDIGGPPMRSLSYHPHPHPHPMCTQCGERPVSREGKQ